LEKERDTVKREVNEPLDLPKTEDTLPALNVELLTADPPVPQMAAPRWLLLAYAVEFLIALIAILDLWSEVGGQSHLDLMPWYIKLALLVGAAWCSVRFTAGIVEQNKVWTRRTVGWFTGIILCAIAMGGITYYYHLNEAPADNGDDEDTSATSLTHVRNLPRIATALSSGVRNPEVTTNETPAGIHR
jgi:hypothetical protein